VSVRWLPLLSNLPPSVSGSSVSLVATCWEKLLPLLPWCSVSNPPLSLVSFHTPWSWDILRGRGIATRDTVPMNIEVPTIYPLSQDGIVFEIVSTAKAWCSTDQRSMATQMLWVLLEERSRTNSPCQWFLSQLFCKIVGYFCRTLYTGCLRRKGQNFGRVFLMLKYTDITQNTYIQSWTVTEIMAREVWNFDSCYTLIDYQIHIKTGRNMWFL